MSPTDSTLVLPSTAGPVGLCPLDFLNLVYGKCSNISNTFLFLFSNKMLVFRAGIHKFLARVTNREDPDQTASSEEV